MKQISLKNFRKFKELPATDLGKLTIMTGGNNSGKSTVDKAVMLVSNYLKTQVLSVNGDIDKYSKYIQFYFDIPQVHISSFKRAINNTCKKTEVVMFHVVINEFQFEISVSSPPDSWNYSYGYVSFLKIHDQERKIMYDYDFKSRSITISFLNELPDQEENAAKELKKEIKKLESIIKSSNDIDLIAKSNNTLELLRSNLSNLKPDIVMPVFSLPLRIYTEDNSFFVPSLLYSVIQISKAKEPNVKEETKLKPAKDYIVNKEKDILGSMISLRQIISSFDYEYISAYTPSQNSIVTIYNSSDYYAQTIHQFYNSGICKATDDGLLEITNSEGINHSDIEKFLLNQMELLKIGEGLRIRSFNNESYTVDIYDCGKVIPLADKGMGSIHLMALLMKLISLMKKYEYSSVKPIIIIEEPEQNLHPKVQSNLADMFYAIAQEKDFPIILETHSEYLVRKLQLIFADIIKKGKSDVETLNNEIKVYFFPEDGAPYSLNFRSNGRYEKRFGSGFLDEASNLAFNLF